MTLSNTIRPIVICVFQNENKILVGDHYDPGDQQRFYRPLGGGINFGESSETALRREIREEINAEIEHPKLLGVLENFFTHNGRKGHEVVFVYDAKFKDKSLYDIPVIQAHESNGLSFEALWIEMDGEKPNDSPVYPNEIIELLK